MKKNEYALRLSGLLDEGVIGEEIDMSPWSKALTAALQDIKEEIDRNLLNMDPSKAYMLLKDLNKVRERVPLYGRQRR